jgi:hypothetical protein
MKLVVFGAAGSVCIIPGFRLWELGMSTARDLVFLEAASVFLLWAAVSFILVRHGPSRDRVVSVLLLCPVSIGLSYAARSILPLLRAIGSPSKWQLIPNAWAWFAFLLAVIVILAGILILLTVRLTIRDKRRPAV